MSNWYRSGTIAVTNGSTAVTGSSTAWLANVKQGDMIVFANGTFGEVAADPLNNTQIVLQTAYAGTTGAGQSYAIARFSDGWRPTAELALRVASFLSSAVQIYSGNGVPSAGLGGDGSVYFRQDVPQYYSKSGGAWGSPISLLGPQGPAGAGFSVTSTTSNAIGTGAKSFTIAAGGLSYLGARMRAAVTASPTNFLEGIVTAATATSVTITADAIGGTGTHAAWSLVVAGDKGSQGLPGSPSTGASSSTVTVGVGSLTFAVTAGLDLIVGQRVRFAETAAPTVRWVEGIITAYAGGSMTVNVANDGASTAGSGSVSAWTFGIIGSRGLTGPTGAASTVPGPAGPSYNATSTTSIAIGTGNKTFAIGTNTAYLPGARVRVANTAAPSTHWMEGECITYSAGNITIAVDAVGTGTGTLASWNFAIAGELGVPGTNGVSITSTGDYNPVTVYSLGKLARDGGASWVYVNAAASAGTAPPTLPTESNTHWQLVSRDGVDGSGAVNSVNGAAGDVVLKADQIEIDALTPTRYTPGGPSIEQHLAGVDSALATAGLNYNMLINGDGAINQRAPASVSDDTYGLDRWNVLTQTGAVAVNTVLDAANGVPYLARIVQSQATAQRVGAVQFLEARDSKIARGGVVSLSGKIRLSVGGSVRFAVLEWTGTADAVTSDVVLNWTNAANPTAGSFFLASNVVVAGAGQLTLTAATLTDFSLANVSISGSCNNLAVVFWTEAAIAQTATFDLRAKLEPAGAASPWLNRPHGEELALCQRYYFEVGFPSGDPVCLMAVFSTAGVWGKFLDLPVEMRAIPTAGLSAVGHFRPGSGGAAFTTGTVDKPSRKSLSTFNGLAGSSGLVAGNASIITSNNAAAKITADAEI